MWHQNYFGMDFCWCIKLFFIRLWYNCSYFINDDNNQICPYPVLIYLHLPIRLRKSVNNFFTCRYHFPFTASRLITLRIATIFKISDVWLHRCSSYVIAKSSTDKSFKLSIFAIFIVVHEVLIRCRCSKKVFWCQKFCDMVP